LTKIIPTLWYVQALTQIPHEFQENGLKGILFENSHLKVKFGAKHKNIIRIFHPTLGPPNRFINPMIHP
jgi:hypothetical protein